MVKPEMETDTQPQRYCLTTQQTYANSSYTQKAVYYTRAYATPVYYTEEFKYYSSPSKYQTEAPVNYTTIALECYTTTYAAPNYYTVAQKCYTSMHNQFAIVYFDVVLLLEYYTTKAAEYYTTKAAEYYTTKAAEYYTTKAAEYYTTKAAANSYYTTKATEYYTTSYAATTYYTEAPKFYS
ncbi:hypothetical protein DAPPUDRAFT_235675 [Daphnia pulex]|uniref:Uncharacterized protein n=1 Tax=Daphnia pulex TaxID=6669 RepID=E9G0I4_DAPPU|nr:hypothetical protein DAPPUDRAFT_235675 [Daphnia pulex]|eukprot:EFX86910.1 hypothetical protein DAPPUDRAFT_235675 [Daphnia pulex]